MEEWRLLRFQTSNAFQNMAIDEAILQARLLEPVPNTLRLYGWKPSGVSIGRFQKIENEVNLENAGKYGVDVVRRISGGGAVYHGAESEITYCVISRTRDLGTNEADVTAAYIKVYSAITEAFKILGVAADFCEGNAKNCPNLTVKGKKISGSSQANKGGVVLQHGTLLLDIDLEQMFTFLLIPSAKTCMDVVNVAKNKITSMKNVLGTPVLVETVINAMVEGFERALGIRLVQAELTDFERELADKLCTEKYSTENWNLRGLSLLN